MSGPIEVYETPESRRTTDGESPTTELRLQVSGTDDEFLAKTALLGYVPVIWNGLLRSSASLEPIDGELWDATVQYGKKKSPEIGDCEVSWDTGGGTQHITQAILTVGKYAPSGMTAPENYGCIGLKDDGSVDGVDIVVPSFNWSERYTVNPAMVTWAYAVTCAYLTGRVAQAPFRGFAVGEVKFMGATCTARLTGTAAQPELRTEMTYRFSASPNATNLTVGEITGIAKKGWEYLEVLYERKEDPTAKRMAARPVACYVHQVSLWGNLGSLGIGS
jgi:hypothetical protein